MFEWLKQLVDALSLRFKSRARLEAENLALRQQVNVLVRKLPKRLQLTNSDRLMLVWLYRLFPSILGAIRIVRPETVIRWHRCGFRAYWRWKSRPDVGRPPIRFEIRDLIRQNEHGQPTMGRSPYPWRTADAWDRCGAVDCGQIHGAEIATATITELEDLPA